MFGYYCLFIWCHDWSRMFNRIHKWKVNGHVFVCQGCRYCIFHVKQELPTLPENLSSPPVFSGVHVTRSLVLYVCFVDRCLSFCSFSFGHCIVCSSLIYGFWLPPFGIFNLFFYWTVWHFLFFILCYFHL
jgi:hypothetical protein